MSVTKMLRALLCMLLAGAIASPAGAAPAARQKNVLLFTHSTGYRHASIEPGAAALVALGKRERINIVQSADPAIFSTAGLKRFDAIIFLSNSTDPKKPESEWFQGEKRTALQSFVRRGGGIVAIHAASDSHYNWPWYQQMIGGHFARHPQGTPTGRVKIVDRAHQSTVGLDSENSADYKPLFNSGGQGLSPNLPPRFAYYVGYLVAQDVARGRTLKQLTAMPHDQVRPLLEQSLRRMATC